MRRESLEALLAVMLTLQLAIVPRWAVAASPAIGTIVTRGAFRLKHATLINNATLFEGATVETGSAASRMDPVSGTRLVVSREGIEEAAGPALARTGGGDHNADWTFDVKKRGVYQLQLVYVREPGTIHIEGRVELTSVGLEIL